MPPLSSRRSGRFRLLGWLALALIAGVALGLWGARSLGGVLYHEDALELADAIFVLAGSWIDRVAEGGHLYSEGYAPVVVLSRELPDRAAEALSSQGLDVPSVTDVQVRLLTAMGVPERAIHVIEPQIATATEAAALQRLAVERKWHKVIVVTEKLHTARSRLVFTRRLGDDGVQIIMRASRYDASDPERWWENRISFRFVLFEAQKMLAYWVGIAD